MQSDLARKARARRVLALARLARRNMRSEPPGRNRVLPSLGPDEIGALFASSRRRFGQTVSV
jgi:hypothetical protein